MDNEKSQKYNAEVCKKKREERGSIHGYFKWKSDAPFDARSEINKEIVKDFSHGSESHAVNTDDDDEMPEAQKCGKMPCKCSEQDPHLENGDSSLNIMLDSSHTLCNSLTSNEEPAKEKNVFAFMMAHRSLQDEIITNMTQEEVVDCPQRTEGKNIKCIKNRIQSSEGQSSGANLVTNESLLSCIRPTDEKTSAVKSKVPKVKVDNPMLTKEKSLNSTKSDYVQESIHKSAKDAEKRDFAEDNFSRLKSKKVEKENEDSPVQSIGQKIDSLSENNLKSCSNIKNTSNDKSPGLGNAFTLLMTSRHRVNKASSLCQEENLSCELSKCTEMTESKIGDLKTKRGRKRKKTLNSEFDTSVSDFDVNPLKTKESKEMHLSKSKRRVKRSLVINSDNEDDEIFLRKGRSLKVSASKDVAEESTTNVFRSELNVEMINDTIAKSYINSDYGSKKRSKFDTENKEGKDGEVDIKSEERDENKMNHESLETRLKERYRNTEDTTISNPSVYHPDVRAVLNDIVKIKKELEEKTVKLTRKKDRKSKKIEVNRGICDFSHKSEEKNNGTHSETEDQIIGCFDDKKKLEIIGKAVDKSVKSAASKTLSERFLSQKEKSKVIGESDSCHERTLNSSEACLLELPLSKGKIEDKVATSYLRKARKVHNLNGSISLSFSSPRKQRNISLEGEDKKYIVSEDKELVEKTRVALSDTEISESFTSPIKRKRKKVCRIDSDDDSKVSNENTANCESKDVETHEKKDTVNIKSINSGSLENKNMSKKECSKSVDHENTVNCEIDSREVLQGSEMENSPTVTKKGNISSFFKKISKEEKSKSRNKHLITIKADVHASCDGIQQNGNNDLLGNASNGEKTREGKSVSSSKEKGERRSSGRLRKELEDFNKIELLEQISISSPKKKAATEYTVIYSPKKCTTVASPRKSSCQVGKMLRPDRRKVKVENKSHSGCIKVCNDKLNIEIDRNIVKCEDETIKARNIDDATNDENGDKTRAQKTFLDKRKDCAKTADITADESTDNIFSKESHTDENKELVRIRNIKSDGRRDKIHTKKTCVAKKEYLAIDDNGDKIDFKKALLDKKKKSYDKNGDQSHTLKKKKQNPEIPAHKRKDRKHRKSKNTNLSENTYVNLEKNSIEKFETGVKTGISSPNNMDSQINSESQMSGGDRSSISSDEIFVEKGKRPIIKGNQSSKDLSLDECENKENIVSRDTDMLLSSKTRRKSAAVLKEGNFYNCFEEFTEQFKKFTAMEKVQMKIKNSTTIPSERSLGRLKKTINLGLKYRNILYICMSCWKNRSRKSGRPQLGDRFFKVKLKITPDGQSLVVAELSLDHNHDVDDERADKRQEIDNELVNHSDQNSDSTSTPIFLSSKKRGCQRPGISQNKKLLGSQDNRKNQLKSALMTSKVHVGRIKKSLKGSKKKLTLNKKLKALQDEVIEDIARASCHMQVNMVNDCDVNVIDSGIEAKNELKPSLPKQQKLSSLVLEPPPKDLKLTKQKDGKGNKHGGKITKKKSARLGKTAENIESHDGKAIDNEICYTKINGKEMILRKGSKPSNKFSGKTEDIKIMENRRPTRKSATKARKFFEALAIGEDDDIEIISELDADNEQKTPKTVNTTSKRCEIRQPKKVAKLAPIFCKKGKSPEIEILDVILTPEKLKARKEFLQSGVPEQLRKQQQAEKSYEEILQTWPPFPEVSHIQQRESNDQIWKLSNHDIKFIEEDKYREDLKPVFSGCLYEKQHQVVNICDITLEKSPVLDTAAVMTILNALKQMHPSFPLFSLFRSYLDMKREAVESYKKELKKESNSIQCLHLCAEEELKGKRKRKSRDGLLSKSKKARGSRGRNKKEEEIVDVNRLNVPVWQEKSPEVWTQVFAPRNSFQVIGNKDGFIVSDDSEEEDESFVSTYVLCGPPGIGKTASVYAVAAELGYKVLEVNASSKRTGKQVMSQLAEATQSHSVSKSSQPFNSTSALFAAKNSDLPKNKRSKDAVMDEGSQGSGKEVDKRKGDSIVLFEDIDIVFEEYDEGFLSTVNSLMITTKRPIILTLTNYSHSAMSKIKGIYDILHFQHPPKDLIAQHLQLISLVNGYHICSDDVHSLISTNKCDIRQSLLELQIWSTSGISNEECICLNQNGCSVTKSLNVVEEVTSCKDIALTDIFPGVSGSSDCSLHLYKLGLWYKSHYKYGISAKDIFLQEMEVPFDKINRFLGSISWCNLALNLPYFLPYPLKEKKEVKKYPLQTNDPDIRMAPLWQRYSWLSVDEEEKESDDENVSMTPVKVNKSKEEPKEEIEIPKIVREASHKCINSLAGLYDTIAHIDVLSSHPLAAPIEEQYKDGSCLTIPLGDGLSDETGVSSYWTPIGLTHEITAELTQHALRKCRQETSNEVTDSVKDWPQLSLPILQDENLGFLEPNSSAYERLQQTRQNINKKALQIVPSVQQHTTNRSADYLSFVRTIIRHDELSAVVSKQRRGRRILSQASQYGIELSSQDKITDVTQEAFVE
ncbi:hypothetical protein SK128_025054 [Halocaridina rubra]|uniref:ATPase family AAA domain-containing protein 5 n=1 Tax=Halocaridina rubra TaxID=373956 RepID=A0AAN8ZZA7_HALRR